MTFVLAAVQGVCHRTDVHGIGESDAIDTGISRVQHRHERTLRRQDAA